MVCKLCIAFTTVANQGASFSITDTKAYLRRVTLSTQDNVKVLDQLKLVLKRIFNWSKYQSKAKVQAQNQYLDYLIDPFFQGMNRLFVLSFEDNAHQTSKIDIFFRLLK